VVSVSGLEIARAVPGVREAVVYVAPGASVRTLRVNEDRIGHVLATAENPYLAQRLAETAAAQIMVTTGGA
jgi:hypothetical protein